MIRFFLLFLVTLTGLTTVAAEVSPPRFFDLSPETIDQISELPIQSNGRIMPLDTFARLKLHKYQGNRSVKMVDAPDGNVYHRAHPDLKRLKNRLKTEGTLTEEAEERLKPREIAPAEWLFIALFQPELADDMPIFIVDDAKVITRIGMDAARDKKRDRYSFNEIFPHASTLMQMAGDIQTKARDLPGGFDALEFGDQQLLNFAQNVYDYTNMTRPYAGFAPPEGKDNFEPGDRLSTTLETLDTEVGKRVMNQRGIDADGAKKILDAGQSGNWNEVLERMTGLENQLSDLALFPPPPFEAPSVENSIEVGPEMNNRWFTPSQLPIAAALFESTRGWAAERVRLLEDLGSAKNAGEYSAAISALHATTTGEASSRGEYKQTAREVGYNRRAGIYKAIQLFVVGFICLALGWAGKFDPWGRLFQPNSSFVSKIRQLFLSTRFLQWLGILLTGVAFFYLIGDIVTRCLIRSRPPISNLYETILFITACVVLILFILEKWLWKSGMGFAVAAFTGALGMFTARKYELHRGEDTMEPLRAVLDTNFWLSTHVTIINIGYAAGVLAAILAHVWIFSKLFSLGSSADEKAAGEKSRRQLTTVIYGVVCFCLLFSLVGTILGGIWANESWGRFWGWDPKENGALLIVLWSMIILHARLGGYIRDLGINACACVLGAITIFSWFHTNNLGIGLHSYGFTSGLDTILYSIYGSQVFMLLLSLFIKVFDAGSKATNAQRNQPPLPE